MNGKEIYQEVLDAAERIRGYVYETPLEQSMYLSGEERRYFFKLECLQTVKSFKLRGAMNKMLSLTPAERARGVATISSGNHGAAVSYGAKRIGIEKAVVIVPETTPQAKVDKIRYFGAEARLMGKNYDEAHALGMAFIRESGMIYVDSCNKDPKVYGGQGTVALEILKQNPAIDTIVVPIGGGGLATGVAVAAKNIKPGIRIIGVQSEVCPAMERALADKVYYETYPVSGDTLCDALVGGVGKLAYETLGDYMDEIIIVKEASIAAAIRHMALKEKFLVEGAAAATLAAVLEAPDRVAGRQVALVMSGGNVDGDVLRRLLA